MKNQQKYDETTEMETIWTPLSGVRASTDRSYKLVFNAILKERSEAGFVLVDMKQINSDLTGQIITTLFFNKVK